MEEVLLKVADVFRRGTKTDESLAADEKTRAEYREEFQKIRLDLAEKEAAAATPRVRRVGTTTSIVTRRQHPNLAGKTVEVPSEEYGIIGEMYRGVVHEWGKFRNVHLKELWGYHIHYSTDKWWMIESKVFEYVVQDASGCTVIVNNSISETVEESESSEDSDENQTISEMITDKEVELYTGSGVAAEWMDDT